MKSRKEKILVVDDEASIRRILETRLSMIGYDVVTAADGEQALENFRQAQPNLVVLEVMLPKLDGYGVCQQLRRESDVPIIMLTALSNTADRIIGLEFGADDYIAKPFSPKELEARIRSVLRRAKKTTASKIPTSEVVDIGDLHINTNKRQVYKGEDLVHLTEMEFNLLELLVSYLGTAFSRTEILQQVWGYTSKDQIDTRVVDVHISRLRGKLEDDPLNPDLLQTVRGTGYMFRRLVEHV